ncbi:MAG: hypothetical protein KatS3mg105_2482 [Gemmatales bacterium]|nr:MAG: hypothetical protein KatS3mg105_2482 [Gemmatales bacterium]
MRYLSLDLLRGIAVILMIQVHFVDNLSRHDDSTACVDFISETILGTISAPLFTFVSGISYYLWLRKQDQADQSDQAITKKSILRGCFLFVAGLVFNFLLWLPEGVFNWDILTLIGSALVILAFGRRLPLSILALAGVMILLLSPPLRIVGDYAAYWYEEQSYSYDFTIRDIAFGFVANGFFPLFPWLIFPISGFIVGALVFESTSAYTGWSLLVAAAGLMAIAALGIALAPGSPHAVGRLFASGYSMYPPTTEYIAGTLGLSLAAFVLLHRFVDGRADVLGTLLPVRILQRFGMYSLTLYVLHQMMHLWPLWAYGWLSGHEATFFWRRALGTPTALGLALVCLVGCYAAASFLDQHRQLALESLMRKICG